MYDRFERLMNERHETFSEIARAIGGRASTFTDWRAGRSVPKIDKFEKLAEHFGVSIDYLVTGRDPENYISDTELKLLESFRKLNTIGQEKVFEMADMLSRLPEYQKNEPSSASKAG